MSWGKDFIHNCLVHPLMPFMPKQTANRMHDLNAIWAFGLNRYDELNLEHESKTRNTLALHAMISNDPKFELDDDCVAKGKERVDEQRTRVTSKIYGLWSIK